MKLRDKFVKDFPPNSILDIEIDRYVEGKGEQTFCCRLEHELIDLGNILGSFASKFGIYFSKDTNEYKPTKRYGDTKDLAFKEVKRQIANLIQAGGIKDLQAINKSKLCKTLRGKILFVYYPDDYLPIYDDKHLDFFIETLNICNSHSGTLQKQQALINWKNENNIMKQWTLLQFQHFLYITFYRKKENLLAEEEAEDNLIKQVRKNFKDNDKYRYKEDSPQPKPLKCIDKNNCSYRRNVCKSLEALRLANYSCELDCSHVSFLRKSNNKFYTEPHHLIPMFCQENFPVSLDVEANIVSLCSTCHNHIHYGKGAEALVQKLYEDRKDRLEKAGIKIELKELLAIYQ